MHRQVTVSHIRYGVGKAEALLAPRKLGGRSNYIVPLTNRALRGRFPLPVVAVTSCP